MARVKGAQKDGAAPLGWQHGGAISTPKPGGERRGATGTWREVWLQEIATHQGLNCRGGVRTTNSPVSLAFHTLSPFGICIQKPGLSELGDVVCRSYIHRVQGWVIQMREKLEGQMEVPTGQPCRNRSNRAQ